MKNPPEEHTTDARSVLAEVYALLRRCAGRKDATTDEVVASEEGARAGARSD